MRNLRFAKGERKWGTKNGAHHHPGARCGKRQSQSFLALQKNKDRALHQLEGRWETQKEKSAGKEA